MSPWRKGPQTVWPGVLDNVPTIFSSCVAEPAFSMGDTTFCIWRAEMGIRWETGAISYPDGEDPDGSGWMLSILDGHPLTYKNWAEGYYGRSISADAIDQIYRGIPLTPNLLHELNPEINFAAILNDAAQIGYPVA
jgi:hypothetical protein